MNTPLTDQLRAYFDDVDRQQGAVDLDALVHSGEERLVTIELSPEDAGAPTGGRRWPTLLAAAAAVVATAGAFVVLPGDDATRTDQQSPTVTVPPTVPAPAWSPELSARVVTPPIPCRPRRSEWMCPSLAVAPDGTLVAYDPLAATLTWYEDEPRVVVESPAAELTLDALMVIGPHDIAYFHAGGHVVAVDPSGTEITRMIGSNNGRHATATGLAEFGSGCLTVDAAEAMPWVDLEGNPITDTAPYPSATFADSGIEVHLGEREWLLPYQEVGGRMNCLDFLPRSDGGVVVVLDTVEPGYYDRIRLLELLPDGTVDRYFVRGDLQPVVLPDGSWIVQDDGQFVHLTPPT